MRTWIGCLVIAAACGGGGGDGVDGGADDLDGGTPDAGVATGYTAGGVFDGAKAMAGAEFPNAKLFEVRGSFITSAGEVDPGVAQSFWAYSFADLATETRINITFVNDTYSTSMSTVPTEGLKILPEDGWMDSDVAMQKLIAAGFQAPGPTDMHTTVSLGLSPLELLQDVPDPHWKLEKITAPPGGEVESETWYVLYIAGEGVYVVCDPEAQCSTVP